MKPYAERWREDRRRRLLQVLDGQTTKSSNSANLYTAIRALQFPGTREDVLDDLAWLKEWGLVRLDEVAADLLIVDLTPRGGYVLTGQITVPGVTPKE
jgi:hypothetical protein